MDNVLPGRNGNRKCRQVNICSHAGGKFLFLSISGEEKATANGEKRFIAAPVGGAAALRSAAQHA